MRLNMLALSLVLIVSSCSSGQKKAKNAAILNGSENVAFEKLQSIRVMLSFVSEKVDRNELRQTILEEFSNVGMIHTPEETSLDSVLAAQKEPFAILVIEINEIATSNFEKFFPIISLSCRMYEESELILNQKRYMGNVWEKIYYVEKEADQNTSTQNLKREIANLVKEFSDSYYKVNPKSVQPEFYIGKNIE